MYVSMICHSHDAFQRTVSCVRSNKWVALKMSDVKWRRKPYLKVGFELNSSFVLLAPSLEQVPRLHGWDSRADRPAWCSQRQDEGLATRSKLTRVPRTWSLQYLWILTTYFVSRLVIISFCNSLIKPSCVRPVRRHALVYRELNLRKLQEWITNGRLDTEKLITMKVCVTWGHIRDGKLVGVFKYALRQVLGFTQYEWALNPFGININTL